MMTRQAISRGLVAGLVVAVLLVLVACGGGTSARDASPVASGSVVMKDQAFQPPHIQVPVRTTVTFTNADQVVHQVRFDDGPQSDRLVFGATFQRAFDTPGTFDYVCTIHSGMVGRVTVVSR